MSINPFESATIFHVMGRGWYVETPAGSKGPFVKRGAAERYLEAIQQLVNGKVAVTADWAKLIEKAVIVAEQYVGPDRRVHCRRNVHDRRKHIRFEEFRRQRRSDLERRETAAGVRHTNA